MIAANTPKRRRVVALAALITSAALTSSACASEGLASLPLPAPGSSATGGMTLTAVFNDALNLPDRAKVKLGGADVGEVESMVARNFTAVTTLRIMPGVDLPKGTHVELRSATPLGDVFVALQPPDSFDPRMPLLKDGDTIGVQSTSSAATVEDLLSSTGIVINGGALRNLTNLVNGLGKATGEQGHAFGDLIRKTNTTLGTLNARTDQISTALDETAKLADKLKAQNQNISELMTAAGPATDALAANSLQVADFIEQSGDVTALLAKFPSLGGTDTSGRSVIRDLNTMAGSFNDVVLDPNATLYKLNRLMPPVVKSFAGSGVSTHATIDRLILGQIPDIGFAGDEGFHGPKWSTFNQIIGSFKYTLLRLQERVVGKGPDVPQVPVIPNPTQPGELQVLGPPPGPPPTTAAPTSTAPTAGAPG